jgi:2-haloacid dehalogenase
MTIDPGAFDALTFDCYGTLIDWETGIAAALQRVVQAHGIEATDRELVDAYGRHEHVVEGETFRVYRDVLAETLVRLCADLGTIPTLAERRTFAASVGDWPAFPDSPAALARLKTRYRLYPITNCDEDLFAMSVPRLGVEFDGVFAAGTIGSYKPSLDNFLYAFERIPVPRERILHVAQSLFHDHVPAKQLGMTTVWVDRQGSPDGGATPTAVAVEPDLTVPDMATLADMLVPDTH